VKTSKARPSSHLSPWQSLAGLAFGVAVVLMLGLGVPAPLATPLAWLAGALGWAAVALAAVLGVLLAFVLIAGPRRE
jgi:hypothetical protein